MIVALSLWFSLSAFVCFPSFPPKFQETPKTNHQIIVNIRPHKNASVIFAGEGTFCKKYCATSPELIACRLSNLLCPFLNAPSVPGKSFESERNLRFSSRCLSCVQSPKHSFVLLLFRSH